ncbi:MAG: class I tRNA ligase family protein, partial [Pseudomonadales bacterium]|nr:class I tRNA ligase family protein [Pseudomonadales bacterium]
WFISMTEKGLLAQALEAVKGVSWHPDWGQRRIETMLQASPDWCVSRQRTWGVPITLFIHKETQALHPDTPALIEQVAQRIEQAGIDAWFELEAAELLGEEAADYTKVTDTLDVWFDSGVTHASVLGRRPELSYPADLYLEGSDQHRGWFQSSLKTAIAMNGTAPYKAVLTHGFTVDAEGRKMSKSLGNIVSPKKVVNDLGADILRLWAASSDFSAEMSVSDEILKRTADSYRRIRNTARFFLSNLNGFDPEQHLVAADDLLSLDRWAVERAAVLQQEILALYESYQFHQIYQKLHNFCVVDMGGFYLDIIKDRQYTTQADSLPRRSTQTALYHIIEAFTRWLAPILSFTADELWQFIPGKRGDTVFIDQWYAFPEFLAERQGMDQAYWQQVMQIKNAVHKVLEAQRKDGHIKGSLQAEVEIYCAQAEKSLLEKLGDELRFVLITCGASLLDLNQEKGQATGIKGLRVAVNHSAYQKCERCWHHREEVGKDEQHPTLCHRCIANIEGGGEERLYA